MESGALVSLSFFFLSFFLFFSGGETLRVFFSLGGGAHNTKSGKNRGNHEWLKRFLAYLCICRIDRLFPEFRKRAEHTRARLFS